MNTAEPNQDGELTGRKLDATVAEHVMEWKPGKVFKRNHYQEFHDHEGQLYYVGGYPDPIEYECDHPEFDVFAPSSSIADAMEVLPALRRQLTLSDSIVFWCKPDSFIVQIWADDADDTELANVLAGTLPEAICRAALAAMKETTGVQ